MPSHADAMVFDKQYYEEIYLNAWRPRNRGTGFQDWTTGRDGIARVMLNTDVSLPSLSCFFHVTTKPCTHQLCYFSCVLFMILMAGQCAAQELARPIPMVKINASTMRLRGEVAQ